ncbi:serine hydrolase domain-containing protein [Actinomadura atramentaria]|uniref:serine hydrolase domain-containing protein n=1 Tax=Actinomadura atramentaria TaxID=1990 RepID=UPI00039A1773|nr:serine hydrolase domain-containing protein [Actinomadura atramentaria]
MKAVSGLGAVLLTTAAAVVAAVGPADAAPTDALASAVQDIVAANGGGAIGMVRDGATERTAAAGLGDLYRGVRADPAAQFRIGSNTKVFASTVLLQLEAEGKLSLDDTVAKWLPGALHGTNDGAKVTIRQLLNHTSGVYDYMTDPLTLLTYGVNVFPDLKYTPQQIVDIANRTAPYSPPGKEWHYANTNYILAGMVIRAVTGHDPSVEIKNRILTPLGLTRTYMPDGASKLSGNHLHGYGYVLDVTTSNTSLTGTAGAAVSTLADQATFQRALLTGKLLPKKQMQELETTVPAGAEGTEYGLGLVRSKTACGTVWSHEGAVLGYLALWMSDESGQHQVLMASNVFPGPNTNAIRDAGTKAFCATEQP